MKTFVVGDIHGRCAQLLNLLDMLPRDVQTDTLVFLGDLIDRGADAPGCVSHILKLCHENPQRVICLRGNHEQMLLDFLEGRSNLWLTPVVGGEREFTKFTLVDARHGFLQELPRQAMHLRTHTDGIAAAARKVGPSRDLYLSQRSWSRYRLQPPVAAKLPVAARFQSVSNLR